MIRLKRLKRSWGFFIAPKHIKVELEKAQQIEKILGYQFNNPNHLTVAIGINYPDPRLAPSEYSFSELKTIGNTLANFCVSCMAVDKELVIDLRKGKTTLWYMSNEFFSQILDSTNLDNFVVPFHRDNTVPHRGDVFEAILGAVLEDSGRERGFINALSVFKRLINTTPPSEIPKRYVTEKPIAPHLKDAHLNGITPSTPSRVRLAPGQVGQGMTFGGSEKPQPLKPKVPFEGVRQALQAVGLEEHFRYRLGWRVSDTSGDKIRTCTAHIGQTSVTGSGKTDKAAKKAADKKIQPHVTSFIAVNTTSR